MNTKVILGIVVALVVILGVWFSLRFGQTAPATEPSVTASSTTVTTVTPGPVGAVPDVSQSFGNYDFAILYPAGSTVDEKYIYQALGPGQGIPGVKFTVPAAMAAGTNLSPDSYLSVEMILNGTKCDAGQFLDLARATSHNIAGNNGRGYSFASSSEAAAGNRYEEAVYAWPVTRGCIAVRYFIHYGVLESYPKGSVHQFDRAALLTQFDAMRLSVSVVR